MPQSAQIFLGSDFSVKNSCYDTWNMSLANGKRLTSLMKEFRSGYCHQAKKVMFQFFSMRKAVLWT